MRHRGAAVLIASCLGVLAAFAAAAEPETLFKSTLNVNPPHISTDKSVRYDYDIVYVRAQRAGDEKHKRFYTDIASPLFLEPGADLMLLHPDGTEELLVAGGEGAVTDPSISFDGKTVFYVLIHTLKDAGQWSAPRGGADIYRMELATRKVTRLTNQTFTPNTGAAHWAQDLRKPKDDEHERVTWFDYGVFNMGPYPLPGGRLVFTSNRNAYRPPNGYPPVVLQLFVMNDDGGNVQQIGYLNLAGALHPSVLTDGRIVFSSLESQGIRDSILWGIWSIHPDGTQWNPVVSAFDPGGAPNAFHFQTQLSRGPLVIEGYYNQNNSGFGTYIKLPLEAPYPAFGPGYMRDESHPIWRMGRNDNGRGRYYYMPFKPRGSEMLTPFTIIEDAPADLSVVGDKNSPRVGKFTHPSGAPDNHLLTIWSPGPTNHQYTWNPQLDGGIYLIKDGQPIDEPGQMLLIKNDPRYNEGWPRAVVPYKRLYGIDEPATLPELANDGLLSKELPAGTPFGLVGSSSLYKRESFPNGKVFPGTVTAAYPAEHDGNDPWKGIDAFTSHGNGMPLNWHNQGGDAGLYSNDDIDAVRILVMEPTTDRHRGFKEGRRFFNHAHERLRILGEIPVRKSDPNGKQPLDPDGNPDTSFLAKIPADTAFTFQTIDKHGMVLNMAQTWHQVRPGEVRNDCGGCHAHSQKPTDFKLTAAAKPDYHVADLTKKPPINVEYWRDVQPILARSCVACHTQKWEHPAGNLVLDADGEMVDVEGKGKLPGTYARLAADERGKWGYKPVGYDSWGYPNASRYVRMFQSRRSVLSWKIFGARLDGFTNDDLPSETEPGSGKLTHRGKPLPADARQDRADLDYVGEPMPPPAAVAGTFKAPDGSPVKVPPLSDADRLVIVRWIDLGCPIDLDYDPADPEQRGYGWMLDDNRPTLALTEPRPGVNGKFDRILIGMFDYDTGIDSATFTVTADFEIDGLAAGQNLASRFKPGAKGVFEFKFDHPPATIEKARLTVSVKDRQGNTTQIDRQFSVGAKLSSR
jgi:hypothetical protein